MGILILIYSNHGNSIVGIYSKWSNPNFKPNPNLVLMWVYTPSRE